MVKNDERPFKNPVEVSYKGERPMEVFWKTELKIRKREKNDESHLKNTVEDKLKGGIKIKNDNRNRKNDDYLWSDYLGLSSFSS